jgi:hypothetical protein
MVSSKFPTTFVKMTSAANTRVLCATIASRQR